MRPSKDLAGFHVEAVRLDASPAEVQAAVQRFQKKFRDAETLAETLKLGLEYALREQSKGARAKLRRLST
jgi:hypothetical protein